MLPVRSPLKDAQTPEAPQPMHQSDRVDRGWLAPVLAPFPGAAGDRRRPGNGRAKFKMNDRGRLWQARFTLEGLGGLGWHADLKAPRSPLTSRLGLTYTGIVGWQLCWQLSSLTNLVLLSYLVSSVPTSRG